MTVVELEKMIHDLEEKSAALGPSSLTLEHDIVTYNMGYIDGRVMVYKQILKHMKKTTVELY